LALLLLVGFTISFGLNQDAFAGQQQANIDVGDFRCYIPTVTVNPSVTVLAQDQFFPDGRQLPVGALKHICANADKTLSDGTFFQSPFAQNNHHFTCYDVPPANDEFLGFTVTLTDQFGTETHTVTDTQEICAPAQKDQELPQLDVHWVCYGIDDPGFVQQSVILSDQFESLNHDVIKPIQLCNPITKTDQSGNVFSPENDVHLKCYEIDQQTIGLSPRTFTDQFGEFPEELGITHKLCTFAEKIDGRAVGGDLIPLDSTMVLVAGTHSVAAWMIPVIVSGIGFAIVIARKF